MTSCRSSARFLSSPLMHIAILFALLSSNLFVSCNATPARKVNLRARILLDDEEDAVEGVVDDASPANEDSEDIEGVVDDESPDDEDAEASDPLSDEAQDALDSWQDQADEDDSARFGSDIDWEEIFGNRPIREELRACTLGDAKKFGGPNDFRGIVAVREKRYLLGAVRPNVPDTTQMELNLLLNLPKAVRESGPFDLKIYSVSDCNEICTAAADGPEAAAEAMGEALINVTTAEDPIDVNIAGFAYFKQISGEYTNTPLEDNGESLPAIRQPEGTSIIVTNEDDNVMACAVLWEGNDDGGDDDDDAADDDDDDDDVTGEPSPPPAPPPAPPPPSPPPSSLPPSPPPNPPPSPGP